MRSSNSSPGRWIWLAPLAALALAGCPAGNDPPQPPDPTSRPVLLPGPRGPGDPPILQTDDPTAYRLIVSMRTHTVLLPVGALDRDEDLWPLLDRDAVGMRTRQVLERNGFRVGSGRPEMLERINEVFKRLNAISEPELSVSMITGSPAFVTTARHPKGQTIFLALPDGGDSGRSFPASTNLIRVACRIDPPKLSDVVFDVVPEVRYGRRRRRWRPVPGGIEELPSYNSRLLIPLRFQVPLRKEHFFVIGPSPRADVKLSAGHQFLRRVKDNKRYDVLLVFVFAVVRQAVSVQR
jgi:hypothetical protein